MSGNPTAGVGDPYWYEWSVGLLYTLDMLIPGKNIKHVILQCAAMQGLDEFWDSLQEQSNEAKPISEITFKPEWEDAWKKWLNELNEFFDEEKRLIALLQGRQESGVSIIVITLSAESYPENRIEKTRQLINQLVEVGIKVNQMAAMHEHYAIIDEDII